MPPGLPCTQALVQERSRCNAAYAAVARSCCCCCNGILQPWQIHPCCSCSACFKARLSEHVEKQHMSGGKSRQGKTWQIFTACYQVRNAVAVNVKRIVCFSSTACVHACLPLHVAHQTVRQKMLTDYQHLLPTRPVRATRHNSCPAQLQTGPIPMAQVLSQSMRSLTSSS